MLQQLKKEEFAITWPEKPAFEERISLGGASDALVMMVDDEPLMIELTQAFLKRAGYQRFVSTTDGRAALTMLKREQPDVLLLDIKMPGMSGLDVLAEMRVDGA